MICNWPINRLIDTNKMLDFISNWIKRNEKNDKTKDKILNKLKFLEKENKLPMCRYDFFYLIKEKIEEVNPELAGKFEIEVAKNYDFEGSLIS